MGTPLSETGDADLSQIEAACHAIAPYLSDGQLVVFKSTLPPGVTAQVAAPILRRSAQVHIAFSPERLAEGRAIEAEKRRRVLDALHRMSFERRAVLIMHDLDGFTAPEMARELDVPLNTVYSRIRLARRELREVMLTMNGATDD